MDIAGINVEYVDVDDALKRIGGNMDLLKRLLGRFLAGDHIEPLEKAFQNGDMEEASRLIHTLKGVSANLSLIKLRDVSVEIEHSIKDGHDCSGLMAELKLALDVTAENITKITG